MPITESPHSGQKYFEPADMAEFEKAATPYGMTLGEHFESFVEDYMPPEQPLDFEDNLDKFERNLKAMIDGVEYQVSLGSQMDSPLIKALRRRAQKVRREMDA